MTCSDKFLAFPISHDCRFLLPFSLLFFLIVNSAESQIYGGGNSRPKIKGQNSLSTKEEQSITISMNDIKVEDKDDVLYPFGFTMQLHEGQHYSFSGHTVTPEKDFYGTLTVPVTVNDGEDTSEEFDLKISVENVNDPPGITGQQDISIQEDKNLVIADEHLIISDPDDDAFTLQLQPGQNYTFAGQTITPSKNFNGTLSIPLTASDGESSSEMFTLLVTVDPVNDLPKITGQAALSTKANVPLAIQLDNLTVEDPDNTYPADFTLKILSGQNYTVSGNQVTPAATFSGNLIAGIKVHDGISDSESFNLNISVAKADEKPVITNQTPVIINEDESYTILLKNLTVSAQGSNYPNGYTLSVKAGDLYLVTNATTISPIRDFNGNLVVPVTISDGKESSDPFNFIITVRPVNDPPVLSIRDSTAVAVRYGQPPAQLFAGISITDVDNDSISLAEISFVPGTYIQGTDILSYTSPAGSAIKSVFDSKNGILALIGKASVSEYANALASLTYLLSADEQSSRKSARILALVNDGQANSNKLQREIRFGEGSNTQELLDIPTAFTPNGDFVNDTWGIIPVKNPELFENAVIRVYTRSGLLVFEATGVDKEWDGQYNGTILPADVYFYTVELPDPDSALKGNVTILR